MKTSDYSFEDATGVEWWIVGQSRVCGTGYVDCWSADGKAVTVRPKAYLFPSGLGVPTDRDVLPATLQERWEKYHGGELASTPETPTVAGIPVIVNDNAPPGTVALVKDGEVVAELVEDAEGQFHFVGHE